MIHKLLPPILLLVPTACAMAAGISSVSPNSADPGDTVSITMTLDASATPPPPPTQVQPVSMTIGAISGTSVSRSGYDCTATFALPANQAAGTLDCVVTFDPPQNQPELGQLELTLPNGFTVNPTGEVAILRDPASRNAALGGSVSLSIQAGGAEPLSYQWQFDEVDIAGATAASLTIATVSLSDVGRCRNQR